MSSTLSHFHGAWHNVSAAGGGVGLPGPPGVEGPEGATGTPGLPVSFSPTCIIVGIVFWWTF